MASLTAQDVNARHVMVVTGYHLIGRADNPVALAEEMRDFWIAVLREHRAAHVQPLRRTPTNPHFAAVKETLAGAPTKKIDTAQLLAQFEADEVTKP